MYFPQNVLLALLNYRIYIGKLKFLLPIYQLSAFDFLSFSSISLFSESWFEND